MVLSVLFAGVQAIVEASTLHFAELRWRGVPPATILVWRECLTLDWGAL
jgi:hypothetical protein